jgi:membrane protein DedA with SNARE-associated domain
MTGPVDHLLSLNPGWVYVIVTTVVFAEDALFVGFVLPGETAAVLGGVIASRGHVQLAVVILLVVAAAIAGDTVGYELGRHLGTRVLRAPIFDKRRKNLEDAQRFLRRRGASAVFLGRFVAFFRAVMPALAGMSHMSYRRFLAFNAAGGLVWGIGFVVLGYAAGDSYKTVERSVGTIAVVVVVSVVLLALVFRFVVSRRKDSTE